MFFGIFETILGQKTSDEFVGLAKRGKRAPVKTMRAYAGSFLKGQFAGDDACSMRSYFNLCLRGGLGWWFGSLGIDGFVNLEKTKNIKPCKQ